MSVDASVRAALARSLLVSAHRLEVAMAGALRDAGLGVPHYLILSHLNDHGSATTSDLGRIALVPPATLTRTLDKLVDMTLVHRSLDTGDRRRIVVRPTSRGRDRARECARLVDHALAKCLPSLRDWEAQALTSMLQPVESKSD